MLIDMLIALTAFIVTATAVYWQPEKEPDPNEKRRIVQLLNKYGRPGLLAIAVVTAGASVWKAWQDDRDKDFLQFAVASTLTPGNSVYPDLYPHLYSAVKWRPWQLDYKYYRCYHVEALTCLFKNDMDPTHGKKPETERFATLVLDRTEVGKMYANWIRKSGNDRLAKEFTGRRFRRDVVDEEILDKVGLLGRNLFYHFQNALNTTYTIDTIEGVTFFYGQNAPIVITPKEISEAAEAATQLESSSPSHREGNTVAGIVLFREIEKIYRQKFKENGITCRRSTWC